MLNVDPLMGMRKIKIDGFNNVPGTSGLRMG